MKKTNTTNQQKISLNVSPRKVFGKKLNQIRKEGILPANIFGTDFKSVSISVPMKDFIKTYRAARGTSVIYLTLEKEEIPVLIKKVQRHPIHNLVLHVDFRKIDLKQKIETEVPVKVVGVSIAVTQKGGVLLTQTNKLLVNALPQDIPTEISIEISKIIEIGQEIKVADLPKSSTYEIKTDPTRVIVSVIAHKEESIVAETAVAAPEVITAKPEEGAEGTAENTTKEGKDKKTPAAETKKAEPKKTEPKKPEEKK